MKSKFIIGTLLVTLLFMMVSCGDDIDSNKTGDGSTITSSSNTDFIQKEQLSIEKCEQIVNDFADSISNTNSFTKKASRLRKDSIKRNANGEINGKPASERAYFKVGGISDLVENTDAYAWSMSFIQDLMKKLQYLDYDVDSYSGKRYCYNSLEGDKSIVELYEPYTVSVTTFTNNVICFTEHGGKYKSFPFETIFDDDTRHIIICADENYAYTIRIYTFLDKENNRLEKYYNVNYLGEKYLDLDFRYNHDITDDYDINDFLDELEESVGSAINDNSSVKVIKSLLDTIDEETFRNKEIDYTLTNATFPSFYRLTASIYLQRYFLKIAGDAKGLEDDFIIDGTTFLAINNSASRQIDIPNGIRVISNLRTKDEKINNPYVLHLPSSIVDIEPQAGEKTDVMAFYCDATLSESLRNKILEIFPNTYIFEPGQWDDDGYVYFPINLKKQDVNKTI